MKTIHTVLLSFILMCASGLANASTITFTDIYTPASPVYINTSVGPSPDYSFTHSILIHGFNALTDTLTGITVVLSFVDDNDRPSEAVKIVFDGSNQGTYTITSGTATYTTSITASLAAMQTDGLLTVDLKGTSGDFYFLGSTLTADATRVPEPSLGALLGIGIISLGFAARKRVGQRI